MSETPSSVELNTLMSLCKRRGLLFQSSEIYGGLASTWDYGPLGVELKNNVKEAWWRTMVWGRDDVVGLDTSILMHPDVWKASGHVEGFTDRLVECTDCNRRYREDHIEYSDSVGVDASHATFRVIPEDDGYLIIIDSVTIDTPDDSTKFERGIISEVLCTSLPTDQIPDIPPTIEALGLGKKMTEGPKGYSLGFKVTGKQKLTSHVDLLLIFKNRSGVMKPVSIKIDFSDNTVETTSAVPVCSSCGQKLSEPRMFNLMFKTFIGPVEDDAGEAFLRPETAQGIFVNFSNVLTTTRRKLPFGIAQTGKAFRNEITTGNFIFRTREFEIMEIEFFVNPDEADKWHRLWVDESQKWYRDLGVNPDRLRLREHGPDELAHYSTSTCDLEYLYPWGWGEISGVANRTDFDLQAHMNSSGESLSYFDDTTGKHIIPYVIEPTFGTDRAVMTFLVDAYTEEEVTTASGKKESRVVLKIHPTLAPVKIAVLPLSRNENLVPLAREVYDTIRRSDVIRGIVHYDDAQSIGKRYRRQDEVGTPLCVTVDFDSLDDKSVTIRERDTMAQIRVPITGLVEELRNRLDQ